MERYQPDQYGRMMPDAHGQWVSLRAAELTALDAAQKSSADAQATIAALQARVQELEEITKVICGHCCEPMEIPSSKKPIVAGWYWWRNPHAKHEEDREVTIYKVRDYVGELAIGNCRIKDSHFEKGEWQGPIEPEE